jgi:biotin transporter BioY
MLTSARLMRKIFLSQLIILAIGSATLSYFVGPRMAFGCGFLFFIPAEIFKGILILALVRAFGRGGETKKV